MSTPYTKKSGSKVEFTLTIDEKMIPSQMKSVIQSFRSQVSAKGFRKGHAPDEVVISSVGQDRIYNEAMQRAVNSEYQAFVRNNELRPVSAPHIEMKEKEGKMPLKLSVSVEVYPELKIGDYKKIKMEKPKVEIKKEEIDTVIENILKERGVFSVVDGKAEKGHMVAVDFEGKDSDGNVIPSTAAKDVVFEIGSGQFLEDLEKAFIGMKAGESKKAVSVAFPKNYHAKDMAGKKIPFDIKLIEVRSFTIDLLTESVIESVVGEKKSVETFRADIEKIVRNRKIQDEEKKCIDAYTKKLAGVVKADLPESWIEDDIRMKIQNIKNSPQYKQNPEGFWKAMNKTEDDLKKEFRKPAEESLCVFLGLSRIVEMEKIELDKDELAKANALVEERLAQSKGGHVDRDTEFARVSFHLRIDKYLKGLTL